MTQQPLVDQGLLIIEDSRSHSVLQTKLGRILCTCDQPDAEISDNKQQSQETDFHAPGDIRT